MPELHQINKTYSCELKSNNMLKEEADESGLDSKIDSKKKLIIHRVAAMDTILSKDILDKNEPSYKET